MKVALELQPALKNRTGIGWYTYEICKRLEARDIDFLGLTFNFLNRNDIAEEQKNIKSDMVNCKFIPYSIYHRLWNYIPVSYNNLFNAKADIYHFFNFIVPPRIKGKVIVTIYDMVYKLYPETMDAKNIRRLDKNLSRSINRADKVITISNNSKKEIIQFFNVDPQKIEIVSPGVSLDTYNKEYNFNEYNAIREKYNLPFRFLLYLGTLEPRKNISSIIDGFYSYKKNYKDDIKLVIAGKKGWMFDSIFEKVKQYGLERDVVFTGYVDEVDKPVLYKMSEIFIFPSLYEGFGMPVIEAMAAGVPVITANDSSLPEVAGEACILVNNKSPEEITEGIINILGNEDLRNSMIKLGLAQSAKFTWENSIDKLIKVYEEM